MLESTLFLAIREAIANGIPADQIRNGWRGIHSAAEANAKYMQPEQVQDFVDGHLRALGAIS